MALTKREYIANQTKITAENLNAIQDEIINNKSKVFTDTSDPTSASAGNVGDLFINTSSGSVFKCTAVSGSTYTWTELVAFASGTDLIELSASVSEHALTADKTYFHSVPQNGAIYTLPAVSSQDQGKFHTIAVMFETHNSKSVGFEYPSDTAVKVSGPVYELNKHYTASCEYRKCWDGSAHVWKWVVSVSEDIVS